MTQETLTLVQPETTLKQATGRLPLQFNAQAILTHATVLPLPAVFYFMLHLHSELLVKVFKMVSYIICGHEGREIYNFLTIYQEAFKIS